MKGLLQNGTLKESRGSASSKKRLTAGFTVIKLLRSGSTAEAEPELHKTQTFTQVQAVEYELMSAYKLMQFWLINLISTFSTEWFNSRTEPEEKQCYISLYCSYLTATNLHYNSKVTFTFEVEVDKKRGTMSCSLKLGANSVFLDSFSLLVP